MNKCIKCGRELSKYSSSELCVTCRTIMQSPDLCRKEVSRTGNFKPTEILPPNNGNSSANTKFYLMQMDNKLRETLGRLQNDRDMANKAYDEIENTYKNLKAEVSQRIFLIQKYEKDTEFLLEGLQRISNEIKKEK